MVKTLCDGFFYESWAALRAGIFLSVSSFRSILISMALKFQRADTIAVYFKYCENTLQNILDSQASFLKVSKRFANLNAENLLLFYYLSTSPVN